MLLSAYIAVGPERGRKKGTLTDMLCRNMRSIVMCVLCT